MEEGFRREYQMDGKVRRAWLDVASSENRGMGPRATECGRPLEAGRSTEMGSPPSFHKRIWPSGHLMAS